MTLSLEASRQVKEMGMPQGQSHQRWYWWETGGLMPALDEQPAELSCPGSFGSGVWYDGTGANAHKMKASCCDAPEVLTALEFLETLGYECEYEDKKYLAIVPDGTFLSAPTRPDYPILFDRPEALIAAIHERWTAQRKVVEA